MKTLHKTLHIMLIHMYELFDKSVLAPTHPCILECSDTVHVVYPYEALRT